VSSVASLCAFRARRSQSARAELTRRGFPCDLLDVDAALAVAEDELLAARAWLKRSRGAGRARAIAAAEEATLRVVALEARRLRLCGAELAVLKGGRT